MNTQTVGLRVASAIFGLTALGHLIRVAAGITVQVANHAIGRRWSVVALLVLAALSVWLWRLASPPAQPKRDAKPATQGG